MELSATQIDQLLQDPEKLANLANLVYITDDQLTIKRHKKGRGFYYTRNAKKITDPELLEHLKELVIPPAWHEVRITHLENGHLQVVGRDDKDRKVYLYHELWSKFKNQTKFFKMISFGKSLPKLRKHVAKDLKLKGMPQNKVLALVIQLMEETHIRIGNHYYAKNNETYGLSTLRTKHVHEIDAGLSFDFVGKKGKDHSIAVEDQSLINLINQCEEIPGWELFQYYDDHGNHQTIDSGMINQYIHKISGVNFSAKDFRTWAATKIFFETLHEIGYTEIEKENKHHVIEAYDATAQALGNTRSVCRSYYVHPLVREGYEDGSIQPYFKKVAEKSQHRGKVHFSQTEEVLLEMIKEFEIEVED